MVEKYNKQNENFVIYRDPLRSYCVTNLSTITMDL